MRLRIFASTIFLSISLGWQAPAASSQLGKFVVVGDSLTAGFQNFSLYTSDVFPGVPPGGQRYGYAQMVAQQAGTDLRNPTVLFPGTPPALTIDSAGRITRAGGVGFRVSVAQTLNLSVPSYTVADALKRDVDVLQTLLNPNGNPQNALALTVLGVSPCDIVGFSYPFTVISSVACAVDLRPQTLLVSLGSNDALQALTFGLHPTDPTLFDRQYRAVVAALKQTNAKMMLANVPDVTAVPYLWTSRAYWEKCGALPSGSTDADFFVVNLADPVQPSGDICINHVIRSKALVDEAKAAVAAYNVTIADTAAKNGAVVLDINRLLNALAETGAIANGKPLTTAFLGGLFSLDGLHPSNTGYALIANEAIKIMNTAWRTNIPAVSVDQISKNDPLIPK